MRKLGRLGKSARVRRPVSPRRSRRPGASGRSRLAALDDCSTTARHHAVALLVLSGIVPILALGRLVSPRYAVAVALIGLVCAMVELGVAGMARVAADRDADTRILTCANVGETVTPEPRIVATRADRITSQRYRRSLARS